MNQITSMFNISYIPILDNYPQYSNIAKVPLSQNLVTYVSGTMESGQNENNSLQFLIWTVSAFHKCKKPCQEVYYSIGKDKFHDRRMLISNSSMASVIISFERNWVIENVSRIYIYS